MTPANLARARHGRTEIQVADDPPSLRLVPPEGEGDNVARLGVAMESDAARAKRRLPKHVYLPTPAMKTY
jgi:hypothetical protein